MNDPDNKRHLDRILYRQAFHNTADNAEVVQGVANASEHDRISAAVSNWWVQMEPQFEASIAALNERLGQVGLALEHSKGAVHDHTPQTKTIAKFRLDLRDENRPSAASIEGNLEDTGMIYFFLFHTTKTDRLHIPYQELTAERFESILLGFIDTATIEAQKFDPPNT